MSRLPVRLVARGLAIALLGGCAPRAASVPDLPRRIAVLPPCDAAGGSLQAPVDAQAPSQGLGDVIAEAAGSALRQQGFEVVALAGRTPASREDAAALALTAGFDGPALFVRVRRWYGVPDSSLRLDALLLGLDAALVDARSGVVLWQVERPTTPAPLYGSLSLGQAYAVAAQEVMAEVLSPLRPATS